MPGPRVRGISLVEKEKVYGEKNLLKSQVAQILNDDAIDYFSV